MKKFALLEVMLIFTGAEFLIWNFDLLNSQIRLSGWASAALLINLVIYSWHKNEYLESKSFYLRHAKLNGNEIPLEKIQKLSRETAFSKLGILPTNWKKDLKLLTASTFLLWLVILIVALIWNPQFLNQKDLAWKFFKHLFLYFPWALLQNLLLNGYFASRLSLAIKNPKAVSAVSGLLFAIIHLPNPVLFPATLIGGIMSAHFFQRNRNLYALAAGHALLAVTLLYFFPDSWHHHLRIGPGFYFYKN